MLSKPVYTWIARVSAFLWGFAFVHLFKYILENIYPFWSGTFSLSLFAYLLIFVVWLSYTLFFNFHPYRNQLPRIVYHVIFTINAVIFYIAMVSMGEKNYLFLYPLLFTLQFFIYFFLIASIFPALLPFKISVLAGIVPGLITYPYIGNLYIDIFLPAVIYLMPIGIFTGVDLFRSKSRQRMLPLRQAIDLLRYLFLGLSFYGIFDRYRDRFFLTAFIISIGPILAYFFIMTDKKKHHIKYGMIALAIIFITSALVYANLPMTYWAAMSFSMLTIWEGIYFKKMVEGDLKREQLFSGGALILIILFYGISPEWIMIISGMMVVLILLRILLYTVKSYRKTISISLAVSLLIWGTVIFSFYSNSFKRDFFKTVKKENVNPPPDLTILNVIHHKNSFLVTNLFPKDVMEPFSKKNGLRILTTEVNSATFLSSILEVKKLYPDSLQIYSMKQLKPYNEIQNEKYIFNYTRKNHISNVYLYNFEPPQTYYNNAENFELKNIPDTALIPIDEWYNLGKALSDWYLAKKQEDYALKILKDMEIWYNTPQIHRQIAHIYGILGDTPMQIEYRQKVYDRGAATKDDKNQLLELYFLSGDNDRAGNLCEQLIFEDPDNLLVYLEWKYKIIRHLKNRYQLETLANTLQYMNGNLPPDKISQKNNLLRKIQEDIKSNPQWEEIYKKEKSRQENIAYPE